MLDDDTASRRMLINIITEGGLGLVIGEAESGKKGIPLILSTRPDVVLIDLLMPELDGIEIVAQLKAEGYLGKFIMISQIVNKEMVGEAYEMGVEFFIHKPINRVEVNSVLKKTAEQFRLKQSLMTIKESLAHIGPIKTIEKQKSVKDMVLSILNDLGVVGEAGSDDIVSIIEIQMKQDDNVVQLPPLTQLYESVACEIKGKNTDSKKESKAIEQRIRRTILSAINNLAALGLIDYTNPAFEYYAPRYFEFEEIRGQMKYMDEGGEVPIRVKINIKKFLQVLYLDVREKFYQVK